MTPNPLTLLPAKVRLAIYVAYGCLAIAGIGAAAYYAALPALTVPDWLTGGLAVLGALAAPISILAAGNVQQDKSGVNGV